MKKFIKWGGEIKTIIGCRNSSKKTPKLHAALRFQTCSVRPRQAWLSFPSQAHFPLGPPLRILHRLSIRFLLYKTYRLLAVSLALGPDMEGVTFTGNSFYAFLPSHFSHLRRRENTLCPQKYFCAWNSHATLLQVTSSYGDGLITRVTPPSIRHSTNTDFLFLFLDTLAHSQFLRPRNGDNSTTSLGHCDSVRKKPL